MKKLTTLFAFFLALILLPASTPSPFELDWCYHRTLSWDDFWGAPDPYSRYSAISSTYLQEKHKCEANNKFTYSVKSVFVKTASWSTDKKSASLLHHEQIHFDLTELHARKLRKLFADLPYPCYLPTKVVKYKIDSLYDELEKAHRFYDRDTYHGLYSSKQEKWDNLVAMGLQSLDDFACSP